MAVCAAATACGSTNEVSAAPPKVVQQVYGSGADKVWVFRPAGRSPRAVVVFLHGLGGATETTPVNHLPWLWHLARRGNAVLYPRFEVTPGQRGAVGHTLEGIIIGMRALGVPDVPVVAIGYSRGGGLAIDYAALAGGIHVVPRAVLSVFPAMLDPPLDYRSIARGTRIVFLVGDRDTAVSHYGRDELVTMLRRTPYPDAHLATELVHSTASFTATHLSVLDVTPGARAAFWARADRLIDEVVRNAA